MSNTIKKSNILSGFKWTFFATILLSFSKIIEIVILTKFLSKEDFGVFAIAMLFIGLINVLLNFGLSVAILHKQNIPKKHYSSLFWLNVITGFVLVFILYISSDFIAMKYSDNRLALIIKLLSINVIFASIGSQHRIQRQKQLDFKVLGLTESFSALISLLVVIFSAYAGYGLFSIIYGALTQVISQNIIFLLFGLFKDKNISFYFKLSDTFPYLKIGVYQLLASLLDYLSRELDIFIISITLGKDILGVYSLCKQLPSSFFALINTTINKVITPYFAKNQNEIDFIKNKFLKLLSIISIIVLPMYFVLSISSALIIKYLYGLDYLEYYWVLSIMFLAIGLITVPGLFSSVYIAYGRTDIGFYWTIYRVFTTSAFMYIGSLFSLEGLLCAFFLNYILSATISFWFIQVRPVLDLSLIEYLKPQIPVILLCTVLYIIAINIFDLTNELSVIFSSLGFIFSYIYITCKLRKSSYEIQFIKSHLKNIMTKIGVL